MNKFCHIMFCTLALVIAMCLVVAIIATTYSYIHTMLTTGLQ